MKSRRNVLSIVPKEPSGDPLAGMLDKVALDLAASLMQENVGLHEKVDGLKAFSVYYQTTRGKGAGPAPKNAFAEYRSAQGSTE